MKFLTHSSPPALGSSRSSRPLRLILLRWFARITSLATFAIIASFAFGEGTPTAKDWLLLLVFPIGLLLGLIIGWWRELLGGSIALLSIATLYIILYAKNTSNPGPYFAIFAIPGILFCISGILHRLHRPIVSA
jgi:hypothetical protein